MCSISTTDGKIDGRVECLGDASKNKFLQDVLGGQTECTKRYATGASHETPKLLDYGFSMEDMDKTRSMCKYIQDAYRTATLMDYALGICYADSMYFMCKLIPDVVRASLETLHVEVIPAMLKRSFTLMHRECRTHENVRDLHLHLFKKLAQKDSIAELSTSSLVALLGVLPQVECNLQNQVIHLMNECFINRLTSSTTDDSTKRILCNHALELLIVGMKIDNVDSRALAKCICSQAQHIKPEHVHKLLGLLVELQFTDSSYISMLEPVVEKAITIDTDMLRIGMIDVGLAKFHFIQYTGIRW
ncbi:hypothetical protein X943_002059 [Babesia divergens]|uniref:Uncharacterized protein n=1 Tax=Babesia divergens TaxID=32595 RepID=A0AAD9LJ97_BABDI|nr:hypothetical protein X943_002059 [Babesia divergens]